MGFSEELAYSVRRDGKRDPCCYFQSIYAYYVSILLNTQWKESREIVVLSVSLIPQLCYMEKQNCSKSIMPLFLLVHIAHSLLSVPFTYITKTPSVLVIVVTYLCFHSEG